MAHGSFQSFTYFLYSVAMGVLGWQIVRLVWRRSPTEVAALDRIRTHRLTVHRGWARVAIALDVLFVSLGALANVLSLVNTDQKASVPPADVEGGVVLVIGVALLVFWEFAHWRATHPRRTKRARFWAWAPQST
ncbi:hypothetical protein [Streptomyces fractus]|uniref:hypothetical protein n=1 Tax=Streptomyces fractus TaxID=641806 RepID=UPI003CE6DF64